MFTPPKATSDGSRPKVTVTELVAPWEAFETDTPTFVTCFGIPLPVEPSVLIPRIWFTFVFDTTPWSVWVRLKDFPTLLLLIIWGDGEAEHFVCCGFGRECDLDLEVAYAVCKDGLHAQPVVAFHVDGG